MIPHKILALCSLSILLQLNIHIHHARIYLTWALYFIHLITFIIQTSLDQDHSSLFFCTEHKWCATFISKTCIILVRAIWNTVWRIFYCLLNAIRWASVLLFMPVCINSCWFLLKLHHHHRLFWLKLLRVEIMMTL